MSYLEGARVPRWVAYHVVPSYRDTPPREGRFSSFRADPDLDDPVEAALEDTDTVVSWERFGATG